ncbi:MAG: hypothetical protein JNL32_06695 [Candidatus Kapabacteria bacterium]|nr:hypothetical protein [Candidatus Kapabacteria bacterium]
MKNLIAVLFSVMLCGAVAAQLSAQDKASPIMPEYIRNARIGLVLTPMIVTQQGSYNATCNCPEFRDGTGGGFLAGVTYEPTSTSNFVFGGMAGIESRNITARYKLLEEFTFSSTTSSGQVFNKIPITARHESNASINTIFAMPFLKYFPFYNSLYLYAGAQAGYIYSAMYDHVIYVDDGVLRLPDGTTNRLGVDNDVIRSRGQELVSSNGARVESSTFPSINRFQFGMMAGFGAEIRLSRRFYFVPTLTYNLQFIPISANTIGFRMSSINALLEVQYILSL